MVAPREHHPRCQRTSRLHPRTYHVGARKRRQDREASGVEAEYQLAVEVVRRWKVEQKSYHLSLRRRARVFQDLAAEEEAACNTAAEAD